MTAHYESKNDDVHLKIAGDGHFSFFNIDLYLC